MTPDEASRLQLQLADLDMQVQCLRSEGFASSTVTPAPTPVTRAQTPSTSGLNTPRHGGGPAQPLTCAEVAAILDCWGLGGAGIPEGWHRASMEAAITPRNQFEEAIAEAWGLDTPSPPGQDVVGAAAKGFTGPVAAHLQAVGAPAAPSHKRSASSSAVTGTGAYKQPRLVVGQDVLCRPISDQGAQGLECLGLSRSHSLSSIGSSDSDSVSAYSVAYTRLDHVPEASRLCAAAGAGTQAAWSTVEAAWAALAASDSAWPELPAQEDWASFPEAPRQQDCVWSELFADAWTDGPGYTPVVPFGEAAAAHWAADSLFGPAAFCVGTAAEDDVPEMASPTAAAQQGEAALTGESSAEPKELPEGISGSTAGPLESVTLFGKMLAEAIAEAPATAMAAGQAPLARWAASSSSSSTCTSICDSSSSSSSSDDDDRSSQADLFSGVSSMASSSCLEGPTLAAHEGHLAASHTFCGLLLPDDSPADAWRQQLPCGSSEAASSEFMSAGQESVLADESLDGVQQEAGRRPAMATASTQTGEEAEPAARGQADAAAAAHGAAASASSAAVGARVLRWRGAVPIAAQVLRLAGPGPPSRSAVAARAAAQRLARQAGALSEEPAAVRSAAGSLPRAGAVRFQADAGLNPLHGCRLSALVQRAAPPCAASGGWPAGKARTLFVLPPEIHPRRILQAAVDPDAAQPALRPSGSRHAGSRLDLGPEMVSYSAVPAMPSPETAYTTLQHGLPLDISHIRRTFSEDAEVLVPASSSAASDGFVDAGRPESVVSSGDVSLAFSEDCCMDAASCSAQGDQEGMEWALMEGGGAEDEPDNVTNAPASPKDISAPASPSGAFLASSLEPEDGDDPDVWELL